MDNPATTDDGEEIYKGKKCTQTEEFKKKKIFELTVFRGKSVHVGSINFHDYVTGFDLQER